MGQPAHKRFRKKPAATCLTRPASPKGRAASTHGHRRWGNTGMLFGTAAKTARTAAYRGKLALGFA